MLWRLRQKRFGSEHPIELVTAFDELPLRERLRRLRRVALEARDRYAIPGSARIRLLNRSENTTFRIDDPLSGGRWVLRVHRPGYHSRRAIESELEWLLALKADAGIIVPEPRAGRDRALVQTIEVSEVPGPRHCVLFQWVAGRRPRPNRLTDSFQRLGALSARLHNHAQGWKRPPGFERFNWDYETTLGREPRWGRWQDGPELNAELCELFARTAARIRTRLEDYGKGAERYGLIHADLTIFNLLIRENETAILDFDDCGFGWYLYDLAAAQTMIENLPERPFLVAAWIESYRPIRPLSREDEAEILPTFIMLRCLLVLAWLGSHADSPLARERGPGYAVATAALAREYLQRFG